MMNAVSASHGSLLVAPRQLEVPLMIPNYLVFEVVP